MRKLIIALLFLLFSSTLLKSADSYPLIYNSPVFNIYMKKEISNNKLILKVFVADNFWSPLINISIYAEAIDKKGNLIDKIEGYINDLEPCPDVQCKKEVVLKFKNLKQIDKIKFSINFQYGEWRIDQDDWEFFTVKLSDIQF